MLLDEVLEKRRLTCFLVMSLLLAYTGPENTFHTPFTVRLGYWTSWAATIWICAVLAILLLSKVQTISRRKLWQKNSIIFAVVLPVATVLVSVLAELFYSQYYVLSWEATVKEVVFLIPFNDHIARTELYRYLVKRRNNGKFIAFIGRRVLFSCAQNSQVPTHQSFKLRPLSGSTLKPPKRVVVDESFQSN